MALTLDGYSAGPRQDLDNPLGVGGVAMMEWFFATRTWQAMHGGNGGNGGETGVDDRFAAAGLTGMGAWILGRNMFGPIRGPWPDDEWKGWWGPNPPYHVKTFVLTHHPRDPIVMEGGTEFIFVTDGIQSALDQARKAAGDRDIRIGGGASTVRQFLRARLIDEVHLAVRPILLGQGEALLAGIDLPSLGYNVVDTAMGERAMHVTMTR
ncbi:MAG TPA: dihydrofolate reductase family protein [Gemmatimonadales bacterium]|nr:dihydrofolate reductase family protein [Gemmatimonadales bacterium]